MVKRRTTEFERTYAAAAVAYTRESQGKKGKVVSQDKLRAIINMKRALSAGKQPNLGHLTNLINDTKEGTDRIASTTLSRNLAPEGIHFDRGPGDWPAKVHPGDLSKWLRKRRGLVR